jgi:hypothetical protein
LQTPAFVTLVNQVYIVRDVLLAKTECPVCLEVRAVSTQLAAGVLLPTATAILANFTYMQTLSIKLPDLTSKEFLWWVARMLKKCRGIIYACGFLQAVVASGLVYKQREQWQNISDKIMQRHLGGLADRSAPV